jgi:hypothetical protein
VERTAEAGIADHSNGLNEWMELAMGETADRAAGKIKQVIGEVIGDQHLADEGKRQERRQENHQEDRQENRQPATTNRKEKEEQQRLPASKILNDLT